jgi:Adenylate and Guanylate cyclase catalytic domain
MTDQSSGTEQDWLEQIHGAMDRGECLTAFDLATEALSVHPANLSLQYQKILALARAGATDQALEALDASRLEERSGTAAPALQEDAAALRARLTKDQALSVTGPERATRAAVAAGLYEAIYRRLHRSYTCINAATMWLVAGDESHATELAQQGRDLCRASEPQTDDDRYWQAATEAEAALHLGDQAGLHEALHRAALHRHGRLASVAATRKQLLLICQHKGIDPAVLEPLAIPMVIHYGGHRISPPDQPGRFVADSESIVARAIRTQLEDQRVGFGYGSLASGADILFAEALLDRDAELHVVLPFGTEEFKQISVEPSGASWSARFGACLRAATSVTYATSGQYLGDDSLFDYCASVAMGQALIRSSFLTAPVEQVVVWDGKPADGPAGTAVDVATWQRGGRVTHVIPVEGTAEDPIVTVDADPFPHRRLKAMLFGDIKGYSKLTEAEIPTFVASLMGQLGATLDRFEDAILHQNTWGDGLYVVLRDVQAAARCTLALQETMRDLDLARVGLPESLGLRIGAHVGPVFEGWDPVTKQPAFYGTEVTRTARIEPRTPEGEVYVTNSFAALLALDDDETMSCQYVGHIPMAKDYGVFPMYVLKRRT